MIRKPLITILGHVDHGKTRLLDTIRNTTVIDREAGAITQAIGASIVPQETILRTCGKLLEKTGMNLLVPGLVFIDTPGHEAFTHLRKRGGNLADIAIVVIDANEGLMPQTIEAIEILKKFKTPFIIALNKIDLIRGWQEQHGQDAAGLLERISRQSPDTVQMLETKMYSVVEQVFKLGFESDRFDRVGDYTKQIAIIPISAKKAIGIAELLMVLTALVQKYLAKQLEVEVKGPAKGTILEIKEDKGLGKTLDVILYDGMLTVGDTLVIGTLGEPLVTKVKALFVPEPLKEMRDVKGKFLSVKHVTAATGVKVAAPDLDGAVAGMPLQGATAATLNHVKAEVTQSIEEVVVETDGEGIVVKADAIGSLEAVLVLLRSKNVKIKRATIGMVSKKDIMDAEANMAKNPAAAVILCFNVGLDNDAQLALADSHVKVFENKVIYQLLEEFEKWFIAKQKQTESSGLEELHRPCKLQVMPNHIFRKNNPAVVGADILAGKLKTGQRLMNKEGAPVTFVKSMEHEKKSVNEIDAGKQLAISLPDITIGRQVMEGEILYSFHPESEFLALKKFKKFLSPAEIETMKEIAEIMRKEHHTWGM
ncbi:translation initiation factor IF-2 [Candidatus Woesearchaeota archaeon]|nr:translation initiation factor IF-2 [Candidatus Woesearchaeota archaeon]